jgi:hypothetical protein
VQAFQGASEPLLRARGDSARDRRGALPRRVRRADLEAHLALDLPRLGVRLRDAPFGLGDLALVAAEEGERDADPPTGDVAELLVSQERPEGQVRNALTTVVRRASAYDVCGRLRAGGLRPGAVTILVAWNGRAW